MDFEFDPLKSEGNKRKHGIDFVEAQSLWHDINRVFIEAKADDEKRYILIANRKGKFWTAIYTLRADKIRIISVRRARPEEIEIYES